MIDPADDNNSSTFACAQAIKKKIEEQYKNVRIILTHTMQESVEPLHKAQFANQLAVDFYLSINFYQERAPRSSVYLYYFLYNPITDRFARSKNLFFYPYDQAHLISLTTTSTWADMIKNNLTQEHAFEIKGPFGIPFKSLIGITTPALALEAGIKNKGDWNLYVEPIVKSLELIITLVQS